MSTVERKKAEIEKRIVEFSFLLSRIDQLSREVAPLMDSYVEEAGLPAAMEIFGKIAELAAKRLQIAAGLKKTGFGATRVV